MSVQALRVSAEVVSASIRPAPSSVSAHLVKNSLTMDGLAKVKTSLNNVVVLQGSLIYQLTIAVSMMNKKCLRSLSNTRSARSYSIFICCSFGVFVTKSVPMIVVVHSGILP